MAFADDISTTDASRTVLDLLSGMSASPRLVLISTIAASEDLPFLARRMTFSCRTASCLKAAFREWKRCTASGTTLENKYCRHLLKYSPVAKLRGVIVTMMPSSESMLAQI